MLKYRLSDETVKLDITASQMSSEMCSISVICYSTDLAMVIETAANVLQVSTSHMWYKALLDSTIRLNF